MKNTSNFESFSILFIFFVFLQNGQNCFKIIFLSFIWSLFFKEKKKGQQRNRSQQGRQIKRSGGGGKKGKYAEMSTYIDEWNVKEWMKDWMMNEWVNGWVHWFESCDSSVGSFANGQKRNTFSLALMLLSELPRCLKEKGEMITSNCPLNAYSCNEMSYQEIFCAASLLRWSFSYSCDCLS